MEHRELGKAKRLMEGYGHKVSIIFDKAECYIDGIPCQYWENSDGYHFSVGDMEIIEPTWERVSTLIIKYIMGEYTIEGSRELHAYMLAHESGFGIFYDAFRDMEFKHKKAYIARILDSGTIYATIDIGEHRLLSCFFSETEWNVKIRLGDAYKRMSFDFNSIDDFLYAVKCVVADYFLNR